MVVGLREAPLIGGFFLPTASTIRVVGIRVVGIRVVGIRVVGLCLICVLI